MELQFRQSDLVETSDGVVLGHPHHISYRLTDIDPELQLYAAYIHVVSFEMGDDFHVPTDFINGRNPDNDHILLTSSMDEVEDRNWTRLPDFIAHGQAKTEEFPGEPLR